MVESGFANLKALVVDDFDNFRLSLMRMLQEIGFAHVDSAINGRDALRKCQAVQYDLVLCDYNLGAGKSGQQVLEEVRLKGLLSESSLFVMVSAESGKPIVMAAYDFEPDAYLTKPITTKTLSQRLERLIHQRLQMAPIYRALEDGDIPRAIEACRVYLSGRGRSRSQCQKLLGRLLLENQQYAEAEAVYREVLEGRDLDWAQVGMAIARRGQDDWVGAMQWAEQALKNSPLCMKAYDLQVDLQHDRRDHFAEQDILQRAVEKSPLSIRRQQRLGQLALYNRDIDVAVNALRRAVRLGEESCYDDADTHLNFVRASAARAREDKEFAYGREVLKVLSEFEHRFGGESLNKVAVQSVGALFKAATGDATGAHSSLFNARRLSEELALTPPVLIQVDWLDCYDNLNEREAYQQLLDEMQARYGADQEALEAIDRLLDNPLSEKNRRWLAEVNREGIGHYENRQYNKAIACFTRLMRKFPRHISIRLNLLQAYIGKLKSGPDPELLEETQRLNQSLERDIPADNESFERYCQLRDALRALISETGDQNGAN